MRTHTNQDQLNLIEETSIELKFQKGNSISTRTAWMIAFFLQIFGITFILFLFFLLGVLFFVSIRRGDLGGELLKNLLTFLSPSWTISIIVLTIVLLSFASSLYSPLFTFWIFDRRNREMRKITTSLLGKTKVITTIPFDNVKFIDFKDHPEDHDSLGFTNLFIMLKSDKYVTLSASSGYMNINEDKRIASLKHHEAMAKKMADFIWG
ncbi:hypothetical protein [Pseudanabaena sp. 'Roaring Creek']|uniref:hypothetical protein n=1 Tax=Pseudanabaena sp. 'Roaring Creek' TaxID=1681830 RepID=UPI0006D7B70D|nr:hypothetical protein [Pseudanabaena sp. 'Roaring Creek']